MFGLSLIDILVILLYFAVIVAIGIWSSRRIKNQEDFFLAGRGFGKLVQTFAAFGQATNADNAVGVTTTTFSNGASGIWSSLLYLFNTPVYWLITPWTRRLRLLTTGDFFLERYRSQSMAATYAVIGTICMMSFIALGFNAMTKTVVAIMPKTATEFTQSDQSSYARAYDKHIHKLGTTKGKATILTYDELLEKEKLVSAPETSLSQNEQDRLAILQAKGPAKIVSHIPESLLIWMVCLIVIVYAVAGGLQAAFLTDTLQGVFIILLSVIMIPFGWAKINEIYGGSGVMSALRTIHLQLPESRFDIFGSPHSIDFTWYYILSLSLMAVFTVPVQPNQLVATGSARDEYAARFGFVFGCFLKRFCTVFWGVFALAALVIYGGHIRNPDLVWGYATRDLLGPLDMGLVGLMIASLMAALMSTADCLMLTCSSLLTHNLYRPLVPNRSPAHYVWAGRFFGAAVLVGSVLLATQFDTILQLLKFIWEINVVLAPAFWLGMKWRRANRPGAWASIIIAGMAFLVLPVVLPWSIPSLRTDEYLLKTNDPAPLERTYTAREADVRSRKAEIAVWDELHAQGKTQTTRPQPLVLGSEFTEQYTLPKSAIFWTQDIHPDADGQLVGRGRLSLELVLLDKLGFDLGRNSHAMNETLRILIRTIVPFLIMAAVIMVTRRETPEDIDRFFAKMRTKVIADRQADDAELVRSLEDPTRYRELLLFPNSQWEFLKWNRQDAVGFGISVLGVGGVLLVMWILVSLGG
ncbi:MAG: sodium:solute symporter family protein [Pirellulales bacterium]|nr:sodium:solute symporter family protein [Pirellulales bacterium]